VPTLKAKGIFWRPYRKCPPSAKVGLALAEQEWEQVQNYADAKTAVIEEILTRARNG
jgi:hypothetical protein